MFLMLVMQLFDGLLSIMFLLHCAGGAFFGAAFVGAFARPLAMLC